MNILITGGAGFIGSHVVEKLLQEQETVTVLDNLSTGARDHVPSGVSFVEMDILSAALDNVFARGQFDAVVHLAGQTMVNVSIDRPLHDMEENINGSVHLLECARRHGVKRVIFSSTAAAYGDVQESQLPVCENEPLQPMSFYGLSKVTVEKYLAMYQQIFGLDYVVLRFANVYGERQGNGGEGGVISIFGRQIAQDKAFTVFGDGRQTRDFVYAGDIANGIYAALTASQINTVYNLSTQQETSLLDVIDILRSVSGKALEPQFAEARTGDIYRSALCNEKAKAGLGWSPQTDLHTGLKKTYAYFADLKK